MKSENYKKIAEIIDYARNHCRGEPFKLQKILANKLADYFEEEDNKIITDCAFRPNRPRFNRTQFLKDCGVQ